MGRGIREHPGTGPSPDVCVCVYLYIYIYVYIYIFMHLCMCVYIYMYVCIHPYICVWNYRFMYAYTNTDTCNDIHICSLCVYGSVFKSRQRQLAMYITDIYAHLHLLISLTYSCVLENLNLHKYI